MRLHLLIGLSALFTATVDLKLLQRRTRASGGGRSRSRVTSGLSVRRCTTSTFRKRRRCGWCCWRTSGPGRLRASASVLLVAGTVGLVGVLGFAGGHGCQGSPLTPSCRMRTTPGPGGDHQALFVVQGQLPRVDAAGSRSSRLFCGRRPRRGHSCRRPAARLCAGGPPFSPSSRETSGRGRPPWSGRPVRGPSCSAWMPP